MILDIKELLKRPIERMDFPTHFMPRETLDPLRAIDEWLSGWGDRLDQATCWERFVTYSPFYKHRLKHEPEPFMYGGIPLSVVFDYRFTQFRNGSPEKEVFGDRKHITLHSHIGLGALG